VRVRERVDGILREVSQFPKDLLAAVISRLKIMGNLDIAERRNAQDGRFRYAVNNNNAIDLRLSTLPTVRGEKAVLRILDKSALSMKLEELGMNDVHYKKITQVLSQPHGIILVTGPTGSGKSTTVYSMLNKLNTVERNIITVEDPVEYQFQMINQVQIQPKAGVTFAGVLRNILRQDPDVIMVGEIRDKETAEIAIRAALTGHLVISTLHTNDSVSTVGRLMDMGIEPFLLASSLLAVVSQRLVRLLCPTCRELQKVSEIEAAQLGSPRVTSASSVYGPKGCPRCLNTGFKGRQPIFEMLVPDLRVRKAITDRKSADEIKALLKGTDFTALREDGVAKMLQAKTSLAEVLKATVNSD
jgi:type II secretory ATPase GspE/PulE/Tfp pilus assembly ATPase PilB-like protein